jgi:endonuclease/exonuclease/phosphatase family metal-dependent hydrolase
MSLDCIETGTFRSHAEVSAQPKELRIVSWNIARGSQIDAVSQFLVSANADLILLQESDLNSRRTARRNVANELAQRLGMDYAFGIEFQELGQGSRSSPAYHGQATLSRWPLLDPRSIRFRSQSKFWHPYAWIPPLPAFQRRHGGRMALVTGIAIGNRKIIAYNLHLESRKSDDLRLRQLAEAVNDSRQYDSDVVVVVGGDFNFDITAGRDGSALRDARFENPFAQLGIPTNGASFFGRRRAIDWILVRGALSQSPRVHISSRASDHYPLSLTLQLP